MIAQAVAAAGLARALSWTLPIVAGQVAPDLHHGAAGDAAYGQYLAAECAACHGAEGADGAIPSLHHLSFARLVAALRAYRDGVRANPAMQTVARSLGDAEIEALAAYFAGQS